MTTNEIWQWLAEQEKACPPCKGRGQLQPTAEREDFYGGVPSSCPRCSGTGRVPLLDPKLMRRKCPWEGLATWALHSPHLETLGKLHSMGDCPCQGRGWVPSEPHLEVLLKASLVTVRVVDTSYRIYEAEAIGRDGYLSCSKGTDTLLIACQAVMEAIEGESHYGDA